MHTAHQRRDLLTVVQSRDAAAITTAINQVLADNPNVDLLEIEMMLRVAVSTAFLVADGSGFRVVIGIRVWIAESRPARPDAGSEPAGAGEYPLTTRTIGCRSRRPIG